METNKSALLATLFLTAFTLYAGDKPDKLRKDDIPRNEKQMWARIDAMQEEVEANLLSHDQRFLDELELARKKVADIMLTAESDRKDKKAVQELRQRTWTFWTRTVSEVEVEDVKEYNLNTALGQRVLPAPEPSAQIAPWPVPQYQPAPTLGPEYGQTFSTPPNKSREQVTYPYANQPIPPQGPEYKLISPPNSPEVTVWVDHPSGGFPDYRPEIRFDANNNMITFSHGQQVVYDQYGQPFGLLPSPNTPATPPRVPASRMFSSGTRPHGHAEKLSTWLPGEATRKRKATVTSDLVGHHRRVLVDINSSSTA